MGRRLAIAAVLAMFAVVALIVAFIRSDAGGSRICALAEATLRDVTKGRVEIGRCHVDPITTRVVISELEIGPEGAPFLAADRLSAGLLTRALFDGRVRVEDVEIVRPRIDWTMQARTDDEVEPRRAASARCLPDLGRVELGHVALKGGALRVALPGGRVLTTSGLDVELVGSGAVLELGLEAAESTWREPGRDVVVERTSLKASVDWQTGRAKISSLDVSAREGSVFAQGELSNVCVPRGEATATVRVDLTRLGRNVLPALERLGGEATARAKIKLDGAAFELTADVQAKKTTLLMLSPGDFDASLKMTNDLLTVTRADVPLPTGRARVAGTMRLAPPFESTFEATLENASAGELLERVGVKKLPVHMVASGTVRVSGPVVGSAMRITGQADLQVPAFDVLDRTWQQRAGALRWAHLDDGTLRGSFTVLPDRTEIHAARAAGGSTVIDLRGTVFHDPRRGMKAEISVPSMDFADMGPYGPTRVAGRAVMSGSVEGPYSALDMRATAQLRDLNVLGIDLGTFATSARLDLGEQTLEMFESRGLKGASQYRARARMDFDGVTTMEAEVGLVKARLGDLVDLSKGMVPSLAPLKGRLEAVVDGELSLSGPLKELDLDAKLKLADVEAWGQRFPSGTLHAGMERGQKGRLHRLELRRGAGYASLKGSFAFETKKFSGSVFTKDLRVADFDALAAAMPTLTGGVTLRGSASGTLDAPKADVRLTLRDWMLGDQPLATVRLGLGLRGRELVVNGTAASPWLPGVKPPPHPANEPAPPPPGSMQHALSLKATLEGEMPFELEAKLDVPDARTLVPKGKLAELEAQARGTLHASGVLARPLSTEARLELERFRAKQGAWWVESAGPAVATFTDGRLALQQLPLRGPSFDADAFGVREPDGQLDLTVQGHADLASLRDLVPGIDESAGRVTTEITVTGHEKEPVFVGDARLENVTIRPSGGLVELAGGHGSVSFSPEAVIIDGFDATLNGGPVNVSGQFELDQFKPQRVELRTELGEIPFRLDGIPLVIAGRPTLSGTPEQLKLAGDLEVVRFRYDQPFDLEKRLAELVTELRRGRPPTPKVLSNAREFLDLDLGVKLGDVRVDNNILKADVKGEVRVTGTNRRPGLLGAITIADGKAFVRNVEYELSSGVVNFTDRTRIRPTFDLRAAAKVREYQLAIAASGTLQQQRLVLSSEPSLPEADLMMLLAFGVTSRDVERAGSASLGGVAFDAASNALGLNDQLRRLLPKIEIFKDAQIRVTSAYNELTGNIEPVAQFESKVKRDDVRLRAQTSIVGGRGRKAQVEWRGNDEFGVQTGWADNPAAPTTGDLGIDFTWHEEWP